MSYNPDVIAHITSYCRLRDIEYNMDNEIRGNTCIKTECVFGSLYRSECGKHHVTIFWHDVNDINKYDFANRILEGLENRFFKKTVKVDTPIHIRQDLDISEYIIKDVESVNKLVKSSVYGSGAFRRSGRFPYGWFIPHIKDVIFNDPATIVFWDDGTKTVVKAQGDDIFDPEKGLAMAITKKAFGNQGNYCEKIKPWLAKYEEPLHPAVAISCNLSEATTNLIEAIDKLKKSMQPKKKEENTHSNVWTAYHRLCNALHDKKSTKSDLGAAMEEAIGYLGEVLDD